MTLVVHELGLTGAFLDGRVRQLITVGEEDLDVYAVRPHIYKHLAPAGSVFFRVTDLNGGKIADSESRVITDISAENYFHGKVRFTLPVALKRRTQYYLELKASGYTYGGAAHVAWCNDYDLRNIHEAGYLNSLGMNAPLAFEMWTYTQIQKGIYPL